MGHPFAQIALAGFAYFCFKKWEPIEILPIAGLLLAVPLQPLFIDGVKGNLNFDRHQFLSLFSDFAIFYTILITLVVGYRLSPFHPLARYPGPVISKVSKLWGIWVSMGGKQHLYNKSLHDQYGPFVRIGPNELSIVEKDAIPSILGSKGMPRGPMWDARRNRQVAQGRKYISVIDVRDTQIHAQLRKRWNEAFSADPVNDYRELLASRANKLCEHLEKLCVSDIKGVATVDMAKWLSFFAFDFMGDLAFGGSFDTMGDQDAEGIWHQMEAGGAQTSIVQHAPWLSAIIQTLPGLNSNMRRFGQFAVQRAKARMNTESKRKDLFYHLYEKSENLNPSATKSLPTTAVTDSVLTIIAGSETSAFSFTNIVAMILSNPRNQKELRKELNEAFPDTDSDGNCIIQAEKLATLPYLNAVINESMRLLPPLPTALQRSPEAGSGGKMLGNTGKFVPEGTAIIVPAYSLHRDPRYFSPYPDAFIPERWLSSRSSETKYVTERDAFIPFSYGPANCVGKPLAMLEIRYVVALLFQRFEMSLAARHEAGQNVDDMKSPEVLKRYGDRWIDAIEDRFAFTRPELIINISKRVM